MILDIISTWAAHTAGALPSGRPRSLATQRNEMRLEQWWADLGHTWGLRPQTAAFQRPGNGLERLSQHPHHQHQARYLDPKFSPSDVEVPHVAQDPHFSPLEAAPEHRHPLTQNNHGGDGEVEEPQSNKRQRLSVSIRRPYEGPHPDSFGPFLPEASAAVAPKGAQPKPHGDFAALLTAAQYRG